MPHGMTKRTQPRSFTKMTSSGKYVTGAVCGKQYGGMSLGGVLGIDYSVCAGD